MVNAMREGYYVAFKEFGAEHTEEVQHQGQEHNTLDFPHPAERNGGKGEDRCCWCGDAASQAETRVDGWFINKLTACDSRPRKHGTGSGSDSTKSG